SHWDSTSLMGHNEATGVLVPDLPPGGRDPRHGHRTTRSRPVRARQAGWAAMATTPPAPSFRLPDVALVAYGPTVVNSIGHGAVLPMVALHARDLGADVPTAATVVALLGLGALLGSLPSGALIARIGERRTLMAVGFVDAAAMLAAF